MNEEKYFFVNRGDLDERLDPIFYRPSLIAFMKKLFTNKSFKALPVHKLSSRVVDGPFGTQLKVDDYQKEGIPVIRVSNVRSGEISEENLIKISKQKHKQIIRSRVLPNDVILTKAGAILGYSAVFPDHLIEGNITSHSVTITCSREILPHYLKFIFHSSIGQKQIYRWGNKSTRPELNTQEVKRIIVPVLSIEKQQRVIEIYHKSIKERNQRIQEAEALLNSIDTYLFKELRITLPLTQPRTIGNRMFETGWQKVTGNRFDPNYYQTHYDDWIASLAKEVECKPLKSLTTKICIGKTPAKDSYTKEGSILVKAGSLKNNKVNWSKIAFTKNTLLSRKLKNGDILFLSAAHQIEYIGKNPSIVEIPEHLKGMDIHFVGEVLCISPNENVINPYYLLAVLNTNLYYHFINRETRGQTSHLYPVDMLHLKIPLPAKSLQNKVGDEFKHRLELSKSLNEEAKRFFLETKTEIEKLILE